MRITSANDYILDMERTNQNLWNLFFFILYPVIVLVFLRVASSRGIDVTNIQFTDFLLFVFATFRLIRLFVYDKVSQWLRDLFLDKEFMQGDNDEGVFFLKKPRLGVRRTISDILDCPWCVAPWVALTLFAGFAFFPGVTWFFMVILTVSGLASFTQVTSNMVGWRAEYYKKEVNER